MDIGQHSVVLIKSKLALLRKAHQNGCSITRQHFLQQVMKAVKRELADTMKRLQSVEHAGPFDAKFASLIFLKILDSSVKFLFAPRRR